MMKLLTGLFIAALMIGSAPMLGHAESPIEEAEEGGATTSTDSMPKKEMKEEMKEGDSSAPEDPIAEAEGE